MIDFTLILQSVIRGSKLAQRTPSAHVTRSSLAGTHPLDLVNESVAPLRLPHGGLPVSLFALLSPGFTPSCPCDTSTCDFTSLCTVKHIPPTATPTQSTEGAVSNRMRSSRPTRLSSRLCTASTCQCWSAGRLLSSAAGTTLDRLKDLPQSPLAMFSKPNFLKRGSSHSFSVSGSKPDLRFMIHF